MRSEADTVNEYIQELQGERKEIITLLREVLNECVPNLVESMEYGMPSYRIGDDIYAFASQKQYVSLYVNDANILNDHKARLGKVSIGKNCIRFRHLSDIDVEAFKQLLRASRRE